MRRIVATAVVASGENAQAEQDGQGCLETLYPTTRNEFPALLNCMNLTGIAVEVGVQSGENAMNFLSSWEGTELVLVDSWTHVPSLDYIDIANVDQGRMEVLHEYTQERCQAEERARIVRTWSDAAASEVPPESVDFVYLDARHDWHGVVSDLVSWWPKVKVGGILAGHDFVDGELPEGDFFVRSAVEFFFGAGEALATREEDRFQSFFVIKGGQSPPAEVTWNNSDFYYARSGYFKMFREGDETWFQPNCEHKCRTDHCEARRHARGLSSLSPYFVECLRRCKVTCGQRGIYFQSILRARHLENPW
mmetsp:Transcript_23343/g.52725  ORF Transcript_23343/g.52725 Transcript_23343/m.52725 type:complete len:307 (+) Transcript_23343:77-997(+)